MISEEKLVWGTFNPDKKPTGCSIIAQFHREMTLFILLQRPGKSNPKVCIFHEDDGVWHLSDSFDLYWLEDFNAALTGLNEFVAKGPWLKSAKKLVEK